MSIKVFNINKHFGRLQVLKDIHLKVNSGELVALLGPSGSGKTTLLRVLAGLEQAEEGGKVFYHGQDVTRVPVGLRKVGFVFQHYALFNKMTVFENVAFGLRIKPWRTRPSRSVIRQKVLELLHRVQLDELKNRYPTQLSGGQRQRVALARALAVEPNVLLLDEPFGALDAKVRKELRQWLREFHDQIKLTTVFVTHDQEEAFEIADRVVIMNGGRIEQIGGPQDVFQLPANEFVIHFLGETNIFNGHVPEERPLFDNVILETPEIDSIDPLRMIVRPHEFKVSRSPGGEPGFFARVVRVYQTGAIVRLLLRSDWGKPLRVEISSDLAERLDLGNDARVYLSVSQGRIFSEKGLVQSRESLSRQKMLIATG